MDEMSYKLSPEGDAKIKAVDCYLEEAIRDGRPIETLIATKRLGEIVNDRAKEAARVATAGSSSWTDVGRALGMTRQAAHEKLRTRVRDEIDKGLAKLEHGEKAGRDKITRRGSVGARVWTRPHRSRRWSRHASRSTSGNGVSMRNSAGRCRRHARNLNRAEQSVQEKLGRER